MTCLKNWFDRRTYRALPALAATFSLAVGSAFSAYAADLNYGKVGDPVHLTIATNLTTRNPGRAW